VKQLAEQTVLHKDDLTAISNAAADQVRTNRLALEQRLSVLLTTTDSASGCSVAAGTAAGGVVHGRTRAQLAPAHAQRIIGITDDGDRGLIALQACHSYVREILR
jgi:hypothetical protein